MVVLPKLIGHFPLQGEKGYRSSHDIKIIPVIVRGFTPGQRDSDHAPVTKGKSQLQKWFV
jgi:hypothetical protein